MAPSKQDISSEAIPKSLARVLDASKLREEYKSGKRKNEDDGLHVPKAKRTKLESTASGKKKDNGKKPEGNLSIKIRPGESLQHFNKCVMLVFSSFRRLNIIFFRRVEDDMRPLVRSATRTSLAISRAAAKGGKEKIEKKSKKKAEEDSDDEEEERHTSGSNPTKKSTTSGSNHDRHAQKAKEFATFSASAPRNVNDIAQAPPELKALPRGAGKTNASSSTEGKKGGNDVASTLGLSMAQKAMMEKERERVIALYRNMKANARKEKEGGQSGV